MTNAATQRKWGVDAFRVYLQISIIWAHIIFEGNLSRESALFKELQYLVTTTVRCAMPFFFITAGYFFYDRISRRLDAGILDLKFPSTVITVYVKRLLMIFLGWSLIYGALDPHQALALITESPLVALFEGTRGHLWFLTSLALTPMLASFKPFLLNPSCLVFIGALFYAFGLLASSYKKTILGFEYPFELEVRFGVLMSTLFFAIGMSLRKSSFQMSGFWSVMLALGGYAVLWAESLYLWYAHGTPPGRQDFLIGSVPFGLGVFLYSLTANSPINRSVGSLGIYALGIYVTHLLFFPVLIPLGVLVNSTIWQFAFPVLIFLLSLGLTFIMMRIKFLRFLVS